MVRQLLQPKQCVLMALRQMVHIQDANAVDQKLSSGPAIKKMVIGNAIVVRIRNYRYLLQPMPSFIASNESSIYQALMLIWTRTHHSMITN